MVERIREILSGRQLTPTQFADSIGVARPIVSHILSGRNKPSLEVVQKIITAFPDLSLPWLLSGTGPMVAGPVAPDSPAPGPPVATGRPKTPERSFVARPEPSKAALEQPAASDLFSLSESASQQAATAPQEPAVVLPLEPQRKAASVPAKSPVAEAIAVRPAAQASPPLPEVARVAQQAAVKADNEAEAMARAFAEPGKSIRRIVIFYRDGTFSDYQPEQTGL